VALLGGAADVAVRHFTEDQIAARVHAAIPGSGDTAVTVDGFPFLGRLAVSGEVERVSLHQEAVESQRIRFSTIDVDLRGVRVDRGLLVRSRQVELTGIDRGTVTAVVGLSELARLARTALAGGIRLDHGVLVIGDVRVDLTGVPLLPCATRLQFEGASVALTCELDDPPAEMLREANRRLSEAIPVPSPS
jgi:hypothetical protein